MPARARPLTATLVGAWLAAAERGDLSALKRRLAAEPRLLDASGRGPYWEGNFRALHYAVNRNHRQVVRWLLARGSSAAPLPGDADWAPLHFAAGGRNRELVALLRKYGAPMDIFAASALGHTKTVRSMLRKAPALVASRGPDGATALHLAASPEMARVLLAAGADPRGRDTFHHGTPLEWAVDRPRVAAVLAEAAGPGVDIFLASAMGDLRRVRALVRKDPKAVNRKVGKRNRTIGVEGETPLAIAARSSQRRVVEFLLEHGASAAADPSPLPDAVQRGDGAIVKRLLAAGADPNAFCVHGHAALHMAARVGGLAMIKLLLSRGARLDLEDREHHATPTGWAEYHQHKRAFAFLKARGGV